MDEKANRDKQAIREFEIKWNGQSLSLPEGSTFLNVKKALAGRMTCLWSEFKARAEQGQWN